MGGRAFARIPVSWNVKGPDSEQCSNFHITLKHEALNP